MVIQRLQNLYLFLSAVCVAIFALTTPATVATADGIMLVSAKGLTMTLPDGPALQPHLMPSLIAITIVCAAFILLTIAKYKTLKKQKFYAGICVALTAALAAALAAVVYTLTNGFQDGHTVALRWSAMLPLLAIVLQAMAIAGIKKDIKILSGYDRLR